MRICANVEEKMNDKNNDEMLLKISEFYKVLSDYTRFKIVYILLNGELCVSEIEEKVGMSQTAVSYQLKMLRQAHLVKYRRKGQNVYYSIDDEHVNTIINITIEHINHE